MVTGRPPAQELTTLLQRPHFRPSLTAPTTQDSAMPYRPTGVGAFGFSLNWEKVPGDEQIARRVITYLEDRRLLFGIRHSGDELHCVHSANEIRRFLTAELSNAKTGRYLAQSLRAMRTALRVFVDAAGPNASDFRFHDPTQTDIFSLALGELQTLIGLHVAVIADQYDIEVEDDLTRILPPAEQGHDDPSFIQASTSRSCRCIGGQVAGTDSPFGAAECRVMCRS
jgi:hypothetical protein